MKKSQVLTFFLMIVFILYLTGCSGATDVDVIETTANSSFDEIGELLQGKWNYHSESGLNETFIFNQGRFRYIVTLDNLPSAGTDVTGIYEIGDNAVELVFDADGYREEIPYEVREGGLFLYSNVESGSSAGTTRIYEKGYDYIRIPESSETSIAPKDTPAASPEKNNATAGEKRALQAAQTYLEVKAFSYEGLIKQLEFEGYNHSEAVYGADNSGADWYKQAEKSAREYLEVMPFSREGLIEQLEYEGFTHSQAVYGVDNAY